MEEGRRHSWPKKKHKESHTPAWLLEYLAVRHEDREDDSEGDAGDEVPVPNE